MTAEKITVPARSETGTGLVEAVRRSTGGDRAGERQVRVFLVELESWSRWLTDAGALLDSRERTKVARHVRPQDVRMLTMAYALHRLLLAHSLDVLPGRVPVDRDRRGRPILHGHGVETSLSHADGLAAFAISRAGPVGVDIEPLERHAAMSEIHAHVCHSTEQDLYPRTSAGSLAMLGLWVRKEALLKAAGVGLGRDMSSFSAPEGIPVRLEPELDGELVVRTLDAGRRCVSAIATRPDADVRWAWLDPGDEA